MYAFARDRKSSSFCRVAGVEMWMRTSSPMVDVELTRTLNLQSRHHALKKTCMLKVQVFEGAKMIVLSIVGDHRCSNRLGEANRLRTRSNVAFSIIQLNYQVFLASLPTYYDLTSVLVD